MLISGTLGGWAASPSGIAALHSYDTARQIFGETYGFPHSLGGSVLSLPADLGRGGAGGDAEWDGVEAAAREAPPPGVR